MFKLNGKDAAVRAAQGLGTLQRTGRRVIYTEGQRTHTWNCRTVAEATETLAVFEELARRQLERDGWAQGIATWQR